jgi:hypothetical protein
MEQDDFTAFEHGGWERAVQPYQDYFERLTTQSTHIPQLAVPKMRQT